MQNLKAEAPGCEHLLQEAPLGILCIGEDGGILRISPSLEEWLGLAAKSWEGRPVAELAGHPQLGACLEPLLDACQDEAVLEWFGDRWLRLSGQEVRGEGGACWAVFVTDVTPEMGQLERLRRESEHDELTGLLNRRGFRRTFRATLKGAARHGLPVALIYLDLDDFKAINDEHGHESGDAVLRELGRLVRASTREEDIVARYGGEELLLALPFTDPAGARAKAEQLRRLVAGHPFPLGKGQGTARMTVSAGVAAVRFEAGGLDEDPEEAVRRLVEEADANQYAAKHQGKDCVVGGGTGPCRDGGRPA